MTAADAMVLTFLGTRGETRIRSGEHARHSALLVEYAQARAMIDCGADWLGRLDALAPGATMLTHAHPDHAGGLAAHAPCPVYATKETHWRNFGHSEPFNTSSDQLPASRAVPTLRLKLAAAR